MITQENYSRGIKCAYKTCKTCCDKKDCYEYKIRYIKGKCCSNCLYLNIFTDENGDTKRHCENARFLCAKSSGKFTGRGEKYCLWWEPKGGSA